MRAWEAQGSARMAFEISLSSTYHHPVEGMVTKRLVPPEAVYIHTQSQVKSGRQ